MNCLENKLLPILKKIDDIYLKIECNLITENDYKDVVEIYQNGHNEVGTEVYFPFIALCDEMILYSNCDYKYEWQKNPLQLELFRHATAGEEFFERLECLKTDFEKNINEIEVYLFCLQLGFKGKHKEHNEIALGKYVKKLNNKVVLFYEKYKVVPEMAVLDEQFQSRNAVASFVKINIIGLTVIFLIYLVFMVSINSQVNSSIQTFQGHYNSVKKAIIIADNRK